MCDDDHGHEPVAARRLSRRSVLQGMVALTALAGCSTWGGQRSAAVLPARVTNADGLTARALAMHLHASSSEGVGSVRSQLDQARLNGFDVAWFNDHDWRRHRLLFRRTFSFTANESQFGGAWSVPKMATVGSLTSGSGGVLVTTPASPNDPATRKGSLRLRATSTGTGTAQVRHRVNAEGSSRANFRGRIAGRTLSVDVLPSRSARDAWGEVFLRLSRHPAAGSRPAGVLSLVYRLRTDITARSTSVAGLSGVVDVPVTRGTWQTVRLDPTTDAQALWPDVDPRDNSLNEIEFHAVSRRRVAAEHFFGYLRFEETTGYDAVGVENQLIARYSATVPGVLGLNGTEISLGPHMNSYGGPQEPFDYGTVTSLDEDLGDIRAAIVAHVHELGGLACINHPFKPGDASAPAGAEAVALDLLATGVGGGADLLEVGYADKGSGRLVDHLAVWDTLARNGRFVTANGVSDDHSGQNWSRQTNRFYTSAWTTALDEGALLSALSAGRAYVGFLGGFGGSIDMTVDDVAPMGSVAIGPATARELRIDVTGIPTGGGVQVIRGDVDYAGTATPTPNTSVVATRNAADLSSSNRMTLDTSGECFYRVQVVDGDGAVVGFGQPVWLLHGEPATGVPDNRRVPA